MASPCGDTPTHGARAGSGRGAVPLARAASILLIAAEDRPAPSPPHFPLPYLPVCPYCYSAWRIVPLTKQFYVLLLNVLICRRAPPGGMIMKDVRCMLVVVGRQCHS